MRIANSLLTSLILSFATLATVGCATSGDDDAYSETDDEAAAPDQFDLYRAADGYRFRLLAGNKNILLASQGYSSRTNAIAGALSVMNNGVDPSQYEIAVSSNSKHFLRLHAAANNQIIGFTQLYSTKASAKRAVGSCVRAVTSYLDRVYGNTTRDHVAVSETDGSFSFTVFTKDGTPVVTSHAYASEASALNGAFAIQDGAKSANSFDLREDAKGFYFTATANNGALIATSPTFGTRGEAQAGLEAAKALLATLDVL